jgi:hypothetical protein
MNSWLLDSFHTSRAQHAGFKQQDVEDSAQPEHGNLGEAPKFSDFALSACKFSVSHQLLALIVRFGRATYRQTVNPLWIENQM